MLYCGDHVIYVHTTMRYRKEHDSTGRFQGLAASLLILEQELPTCQLSLSNRLDKLALFSILPPKL